MSLILFHQQQNEDDDDEYTIITEEKQDYMIPPSFDGNPTFRTAHFLKPLFNPRIKPLPKTPFHSSSSNPNIINDVAKRVNFKGRLKPQRSWESWVEDLAKTHEILWKKVGIFDAIKGSTYKIKRDNELIICLADKWCAETNTFVFSWGECTVTLEDIMVLGGLSVMGDSVYTLSYKKKYAEIEGELVKSCSVIRKSNTSVSQYGWMDYFKGKGGEIEHVGLIVLWLSRCVFSYKHSNHINKKVFGIAINLVMGIKLALAPAVLASIYRDLTLLKEKITFHSMEGVVDKFGDLDLWAPFHLVQLWAWERFPGLSPKPKCLVPGEPRVARWHDVSKVTTSSLRLDDESDAEKFIWRPYALCLNNWQFPKFYCDYGMWVVITSEVDEELLSYVRCLRASELVGFDCVMQYLPHRVGMQFGMDQDIPDFVPRSDDNAQLAWASYDTPLEGLKLYLPPRLSEGDVTVQYSRWWKPVLVPDDAALITYTRHKRGARKCKSLSQLLEDMESQKQANVVKKIASKTSLNEKEDTRIYNADTIAEEYERSTANEHTSKGNCAQDTESLTMELCNAVNAIEPPVGSETGVLCSVLAEDQNHCGKDAIEPAVTKELSNAVNAIEPPVGSETKNLCSVLAEDQNHRSKDAIEPVVEQVCDTPIDADESNDNVKDFHERRLVLEYRMSRLERILSKYKEAKFRPS